MGLYICHHKLFAEIQFIQVKIYMFIYLLIKKHVFELHTYYKYFEIFTNNDNGRISLNHLSCGKNYFAVNAIVGSKTMHFYSCISDLVF